MSPRRILSAGVALCLLAALPLVVRADGKDAPKPSLESLQKSIEDLSKEFKLVILVNRKSQKDVAAMSKQFDTLEKEVVGLGQAMIALQKEQVRISAYYNPTAQGGNTEEPVGMSLEARVRQLESRLKALEIRVDGIKPPSPSPSPSLLQQIGTIRLENRIGLPATMVINGVAYRLEPYQVQTLTGYQAGTFTFEVMVDGYGLTASGTRVLRPNATYTLWTY